MKIRLPLIILSLVGILALSCCITAYLNWHLWFINVDNALEYYFVHPPDAPNTAIFGTKEQITERAEKQIEVLSNQDKNGILKSVLLKIANPKEGNLYPASIDKVIIIRRSVWLIRIYWGLEVVQSRSGLGHIMIVAIDPKTGEELGELSCE